MPILIREARINEFSTLSKVSDLSKIGDISAVKHCVVSAFNKYIERIGKKPAPMLLDFFALIEARQVWVAELNAIIVGVLVQYVTEQGFYLDTLAVLPNYQGKGVGKALLLFAEQEAIRQNFSSLYLCTHSKMTENQALYRRSGYIEFDRKIDAGYDRVFYRKSLQNEGIANNNISCH